MISTIKASFEEAGFIVAATALGNLDLEVEITEALKSQRSTSPAAQILHAYPELFIYPRALPPRRACIFGVVLEKGTVIDPARRAALEKYFPVSRTVVFGREADRIVASWY